MNTRFKIILVILIAIILRLWVATLGYNYDMESWDIVSDLVLDGDVIYAHTKRYNYGYLWGVILAGLKWFMHLLNGSGIETFHLYIVVFLSLVDIGIAAWARKYFGDKVALLFLLNPISILITGYHSQFENLALLLALLSITPLLKAEVKTKQIILAAVLMGLSLITKHLYFMFPLWFLFRPVITVKHRFVYAFASCGLFFISFAPFLFDADSLSGIWDNIVSYKGLGANSWLVFAQDVLLSNALETDFYKWELFTYHKVVFLVLLGLVGYLFRKQNIKLLILLYPLALLSTTCMLLSEYLIMAVLIVLIFIEFIEAKVFILLTTFYLLFVSNAYNVGALDTISIFSEKMQALILQYVTPALLQFFLAMLLLRIGYRFIIKTSEEPDRYFDKKYTNIK